MKKIVLFVGIFLCLLPLQAQFTVETTSGTPILDGDVVTFGQVGEPSKLYYYINNTSTNTINMRVEFVSALNADGSKMQFCIEPTCYYHITVGESYPQEQPNGMSVTIAPGGQSNYGDHFMNSELGNGTDPVEYVFKFYQISDFGLPTGTPLTFTYRYDPLLGTQEMNKLDIAMYPTISEDFVTVETGENLNMTIYDLRGRLVKRATLSGGENQVGLSSLSAQMYLVRFENELGQSQTSKLIVK